MKTKGTIWIYPLAILGVFLMLTTSCKKKDDNNTPPTTEIVTDIDGNVYHSITIGTQVWMVENLKTTKYRNGDPIPNVTEDTWGNLTTGAYCNYNNNANNSTTYGRLYNWFAVNDSRNIAPTGWHVPNDAEWATLTNYLVGNGVAGGKLKEKGTTHWQSPNIGATNESNFTALPGGYRLEGGFVYIGKAGCWWSTTVYNTPDACYQNLWYDSEGLGFGNYSLVAGYSVRCLRD
jgi:uncharacterized protein (TIGR02145 family)